MRYENLHKHTKYSNIMTPDSVISIEDIAKRAVELGHKTLCTTEHGYAGNVFEYYDVAKKYGLKLVFGVEFYYVHDRKSKDRTNAHLLILAKTNRGKKELTKLISESNKTGFYYKPRIDKELLFSLDSKDVVVTSTCIASPYNLYKDECFIEDCHKHFGDSFYLELHDNTNIKQVEYNKKLLKMHKKYNIPFIFATDTHYIHEEDGKWRDLLLKGKGINYPEEEGFILDYPESEKVFERFEKQGVFTREQIESSLRNTCIVDGFEEIIMDRDGFKMPSIHPKLSHKEKIKELKKIINSEWVKDRIHIPEERHKEYINAIQFEMNIIEETEMEDYFLLNYPIIKRGKELGGVLTRTGRGSAPSFYLNKLLGFTEVDRLDSPITLYPTRFMSISRILETRSLPDIDYNASSPYPFIQATKEILGEDNVYWMTAYGTMKESEAFRNMCRALGMSSSEFNDVGKDIDSYRDDPKWSKIIEDSKVFIGVIDSVSPHPCANLLLSQPISEEVGVIKVGDEFCALIDSDTSDSWKYLKNDYLTVTVWKIIADAFNLIGRDIPDVRTISRLAENDNKVWDMYSKGLTATLNQAGSNSGTPQVVQYKPKSVRELSGWVSAIRPAFASMKSYFLNRESFSYEIPEFDELLSESDNFILYQENVMKALVYADFSEDETYGLLKAISKKKQGIIEPIHDKFIEGFMNKGNSEENALKVWKIIEDSVGYGFNASHAYSVALDSVYGAYLKANYPLEYYTTVLNIYRENTTQTAKIMRELPYFNINVEPITFGKSRGDYSFDKETNNIYKGVGSIKYMNVAVSEELYELSKTHKKESFIKLLIDIAENTKANKTHISTLIRLDYFLGYGEKQKLLTIYEEFRDGKSKYSKTHIDKTKEKRLLLLEEFEREIMSSDSIKIDIGEQVLFEKEVLGYAITKFPDVNSSLYLITDIDEKFTPKVHLYKLKDGQEIMHKIAKKKFYRENGKAFGKGDVIQLVDVDTRSGWKKVGDDWVEDESKKEDWINKFKIVRKKKD